MIPFVITTTLFSALVLAKYEIDDVCISNTFDGIFNGRYTYVGSECLDCVIFGMWCRNETYCTAKLLISNETFLGVDYRWVVVTQEYSNTFIPRLLCETVAYSGTFHCFSVNIIVCLYVLT